MGSAASTQPADLPTAINTFGSHLFDHVAGHQVGNCIIRTTERWRGPRWTHRRPIAVLCIPPPPHPLLPTLWIQQADPGDGLFLSPYGIAQALAMVLNGAEPGGESYRQLQVRNSRAGRHAVISPFLHGHSHSGVGGGLCMVPQVMIFAPFC